MIDLPRIRVGIDWDGDGVIDYDDLSTDPLNTMPNNAILREDQTMAIGATAYAVVDNPNEYSDYAYFVDNQALNGGIRFFTRANYFATRTTVGPNVFQPGSFSIPAAGTYTLSVMIKQVSGFATVLLELEDEAHFETGSGFIASASQAVTSTWTRMSLTFTIAGGSYPRPVHMKATNSASGNDFFLSYRASLILGSTALVKFNDGTLRPYDNVTADVMSATWQLGRQNADDMFPAEGTLELILKNDTRKYSPEYVSSPIHGLMKKNRKVVVEIQNPVTSAWVIMWAGWIRQYSPSVRGNGDIQARISAEQGIFRLNDLKPLIGVQLNTDFLTILDQILAFGWTPANHAAGNADKTYLDINALAVDLANVRNYSPLDGAGALTIFPVVGDGWTEDTSASIMIKEMLEVERGYFFIGRTGLIQFSNRHAYQTGIYNPLLESISIDTNLNDGTYGYGDNVYNVIKVGYYPKEYTNTSIWVSKVPLIVNRKSIKTFDIEFEYPEGSDITVSTLDIPASTITAKTSTGTVIASNNYLVEVVELKNSAAKIKIHNYYGSPLRFTIDLHGTKITSFGNQLYTAEIADYSPQYDTYKDEGKREKSFSNKLIMNEDMALGIGDYLLARYGLPRSVFKTLKMKSRDSAWLVRQLSYTLGVNIAVSEFQTAFTQSVVIVGEQHTWQPGMLESTYTVTPPEFYSIDPLLNNTNSFFVGY